MDRAVTPDPAGIALRALTHADVPAALAIQTAVYPAFLREDAAAFASRIDLPGSYCLAATRDGALLGYLLAHGWPPQSPPPVGTVLAPARCEVLFVHDLAVSAAARGAKVGALAMARACARAAANGLHRVELIAVEGAEDYWRGQGFEAIAVPTELARKIAGYGAQARWMTRAI